LFNYRGIFYLAQRRRGAEFSDRINRILGGFSRGERVERVESQPETRDPNPRAARRFKPRKARKSAKAEHGTGYERNRESKSQPRTPDADSARRFLTNGFVHG